MVFYSQTKLFLYFFVYDWMIKFCRVVNRTRTCNSEIILYFGSDTYPAAIMLAFLVDCRGSIMIWGFFHFSGQNPALLCTPRILSLTKKC